MRSRVRRVRVEGDGFWYDEAINARQAHGCTIEGLRPGTPYLLSTSYFTCKANVSVGVLSEWYVACGAERGGICTFCCA